MTTWNSNNDPYGQGSSKANSMGHSESQQASKLRFEQTQRQVHEVVDIMRSNVNKVLERDSKLSELDARADALNQGASQFEQQATKLKRKYWWKNLKMMVILGIVVVILLIILAYWISTAFTGGNDNNKDGGDGSGKYILPGQNTSNDALTST